MSLLERVSAWLHPTAKRVEPDAQGEMPEEIRVIEAQHQPPAKPRLQTADQRQPKGAEHAADDDAPGEAVRAHRGAAEQATGDDAARVHQRRQGGQRVPVARLERGAQQAADQMKGLGRQQDAGEAREIRGLGRVKSRRDDVNQPGHRQPQPDPGHAHQRGRRRRSG